MRLMTWREHIYTPPVVLQRGDVADCVEEQRASHRALRGLGLRCRGGRRAGGEPRESRHGPTADPSTSDAQGNRAHSSCIGSFIKLNSSWLFIDLLPSGRAIHTPHPPPSSLRFRLSPSITISLSLNHRFISMFTSKSHYPPHFLSARSIPCSSYSCLVIQNSSLQGGTSRITRHYPVVKTLFLNHRVYRVG